MAIRNSLSPLKKHARLVVLTGAFLGLAGTSGCDDPFGLNATIETRRDTLVAFAMTGTPSSFVSGFNAATGALVRIGPDVGFDVAFDLEADGKVRVIPARLISQVKQSFGIPSATQQVGLLAPTGTFDGVTRAPESGFKRDTALVVARGQPVIVEVASEACQFSLASILYAKLVVDSVNTSSRQIYFRTVRNPNCGFRSFLPGVPKN
ncbi:MAG: hypothetical protein IPK85_17320 [Gemmatimonadetes bacterium]|nr:hypothetical protein [Gemmatimonadota bacterium]